MRHVHAGRLAWEEGRHVLGGGVHVCGCRASPGLQAAHVQRFCAWAWVQRSVHGAQMCARIGVGK